MVTLPALFRLIVVLLHADCAAFRETQVAKLHAGCNHAVAAKLGDVVSLNLTMLKGTLTH